jgi:serine/threonine-protein kinase
MAMQADDIRGLESTGDFGARMVGAGGMIYSAFMAIGEGGMARVLLAKANGPSGFEKLVVLKTIRKSALSNPEVRKLFVAEAKLCAQLNHPNLVQVYDVDLDAPSPCLVMEYLEGKSLHEVILANALPRPMLLAICLEVLAGLNYAHELCGFDGQSMNVIHRDVSPQNVFITYEGAAKVLDFGIAKMAGAVSDTVTEEVKGKLSYMAPEQLLGTGVDRRTDVFAVGVMLWEIAVGRRLWHGISEPALMHRLATGDIPPVPADAEVPSPLADIIAKATAAEPDGRYQSASELRLALSECLSTLGWRPAMREVGEALASAFAEDREETASRIRLALAQREGSSARPGKSSARPGKEPAPKKSHSGVLALLAATAFALGATFWAFSDLRTASEPAVQEAPRKEVSSPPTVGVSPALAAEDEVEEATAQAAAPSSDRPPSTDTQAAAPSSDRTAFTDRNEDDAASSESAGNRGVVAPTIQRSAPARSRPARDRSAAKSSGTPTPGTSATKTDCEARYFVKDGIKTYRPECL